MPHAMLHTFRGREEEKRRLPELQGKGACDNTDTSTSPTLPAIFVPQGHFKQLYVYALQHTCAEAGEAWPSWKQPTDMQGLRP